MTAESSEPMAKDIDHADKRPLLEHRLAVEDSLTDQEARQRWRDDVNAAGMEQVRGGQLGIQVVSHGSVGLKVVYGHVQRVIPKPEQRQYWVPDGTPVNKAIELIDTAMALEDLIPNPNITDEDRAGCYYMERFEAHALGKNKPAEDAFRITGVYFNIHEYMYLMQRNGHDQGDGAPTTANQAD